MKHFLILCDVLFGVAMSIAALGLIFFGLVVFWSLFSSVAIPVKVALSVFIALSAVLFFIQAKEKREEVVDEQKSK